MLFSSFLHHRKETLLANVIFSGRRGTATTFVRSFLISFMELSLRTVTIRLDINSTNWAHPSFLIRKIYLAWTISTFSEQRMDFIKTSLSRFFFIARDEFYIIFYPTFSKKCASIYRILLHYLIKMKCCFAYRLKNISLLIERRCECECKTSINVKRLMSC